MAPLIHSEFMRLKKTLRITSSHRSKRESSDSLWMELLKLSKPVKWALTCLVVFHALYDVLTRLLVHF